MKHKLFAFLGKLLRRKRRNCFRFLERPRKSGKWRCTMASQKREFEPTTGDEPCCKQYYPRWAWRIHGWRSGSFGGGIRWRAEDWWRAHVRVPLGSHRKPIAIAWQESYSEHSNHPQGLWPECPRCGDESHPAYSFFDGYGIKRGNSECGGSTDWYDTLEEAVAVWNKHTGPLARMNMEVRI